MPNAIRPGAIAVIGMSGRFPGAADLAAFWANLRAGVESITLLHRGGAARRRRVASRTSATRPTSRRCGRLDDIDQFDAGVLRDEPARRRGVRSPAPPVPRVRLGGVRARRLRRRARSTAPSGVFASCGVTEYMMQNLLRNRQVDGVGRRVAGAPHRQRHELPRHARLLRAEPHGPSMNVQTACSSSLRRRAPRLPEPAQRRVRHGARRRLRRSTPSRTAATSTRRARSSRPTATAGRSTRKAAGTVIASAVGCVVLQRARRRDRATATASSRSSAARRSTTTARRRSATSRRAWPARRGSSPRRWRSPASNPETSRTSRPTAPAR